MSDLLAVRCAVCHVPAGMPCRTLGDHAGVALPNPHRGRDGTDVRDRGTCEIGWHANSGPRPGSHDCNRDDGHGAVRHEDVGSMPYETGRGAWVMDPPSDHVCRCGDRFSHAAAVGMSS